MFDAIGEASPRILASESLPHCPTHFLVSASLLAHRLPDHPAISQCRPLPFTPTPTDQPPQSEVYAVRASGAVSFKAAGKSTAVCGRARGRPRPAVGGLMDMDLSLA